LRFFCRSFACTLVFSFFHSITLKNLVKPLSRRSGTQSSRAGPCSGGSGGRNLMHANGMQRSPAKLAFVLLHSCMGESDGRGVSGEGGGLCIGGSGDSFAHANGTQRSPTKLARVLGFSSMDKSGARGRGLENCTFRVWACSYRILLTLLVNQLLYIQLPKPIYYRLAIFCFTYAPSLPQARVLHVASDSCH
jgi:hypothetical protein